MGCCTPAAPRVKLPWQADLVVRASRELEDIEKLVWCEDRGLDQGPDGCYVGGGTIGERLGRSPDTVERTRRELVRLSLHSSRPRAGAKSYSWFALLPADAVPVCPPGVEAERWRPDPAEVRRLAHRLDIHVYGIRGHRAYKRTGRIGAADQSEGLAATVPPHERTSGGNAAATNTGPTARTVANRGTAAITHGGNGAGNLAAALPPGSKQLVRERPNLSSSDESELVAHATKAESENGQDPTGLESAPRASQCGRPVSMSKLLREYAPAVADEYERWRARRVTNEVLTHAQHPGGVQQQAVDSESSLGRGEGVQSVERRR